MELRYVLYREVEGVYLGNGIWSRLHSSPAVWLPETAPTFSKKEAESLKLQAGQNNLIKDAELKEVHPGREDRSKVTPEDCANALLPAWIPSR